MQIPGNIYTICLVFKKNVKKTNEIILTPFWFDLRLNTSLITTNVFIPGQAIFHGDVNPYPEKSFGEVYSRYYFSFTLLPQPPWKTKQILRLTVGASCLCVCASVWTLTACSPCVTLREWIHAVSWVWELGAQLSAGGTKRLQPGEPPKGRWSTATVPWGSSSALESCFDRATELGAEVKFLGHQTSTDFLLAHKQQRPLCLGGIGGAGSEGRPGSQGWLESLAGGKRARNIESQKWKQIIYLFF